MSQPAAPAKSEIETSTIRTISWRLIPFLVLAYFFSYLDRVNLGFAALTMNADLKFTPLIFAWAPASSSSAISSSRCRAISRWRNSAPAAGSPASW
jgi:sugar phosphate permease